MLPAACNARSMLLHAWQAQGFAAEHVTVACTASVGTVPWVFWGLDAALLLKLRKGTHSPGGGSLSRFFYLVAAVPHCTLCC